MNDALAIDGGTPAVKAFPPRRLIGLSERKAILELVDRSIEQGLAFDRYGGVETDCYEKEFAAWLGVSHATAVSSGTAAVHTALSALALEPGSEVICSPITDPGAVMPVVWNLCIPVFADTSPETFNVTPQSVEAVVSERTRAIIVGHIAGDPAAIDEIVAIAAHHRLPLIEDCAQAHGATWRGRRVGSFGTISAWSLMSGKHHTSGGQGGMVCTNDSDLCQRAKRFADRGKSMDNRRENLFLGLNYRMTDLEAAIGRVQLARLVGCVVRRQQLVSHLAERMNGKKAFSIGYVPHEGKSAYWFLRIRVHLDRLKVDKAQAAKALAAEGVPAAATYTSLIHKQAWFAQRITFGRSGLPWTLPGVKAIDYEASTPNAAAALANHMICSFHEDIDEATIDAMARAFAKVERAYLR